MAKPTAFETILFEKRQDIAYITLNRPRVLNAYSIQMRDDLWEALTAIKDDPEIRAVILKGAGRAFCAGADLTEFLTAPSPTTARDIRRERDIYHLLLTLPQPTIATLHGYVIGSGIELSLTCDIRIASDDAVFALPETGFGFIPGAGATQLLPRTASRGAALKMVLTGKRIKADEALRIGLINQIVPRRQLLKSTRQLAGKLSLMPPPVLWFVKQSVNRGLDMPLVQGLRLEDCLNTIVRQAST
ncbi:MAG: enoyl-CoA hydratase/isomerase family protein [Chloroflexota bacterium]